MSAARTNFEFVNQKREAERVVISACSVKHGAFTLIVKSLRGELGKIIRTKKMLPDTQNLLGIVSNPSPSVLKGDTRRSW